jgi:hypothetical protein
MEAPTPSALAEFLNGSAPLDGVWFGERHPTDRGMYWWRKYLAALAQPAKGDGDVYYNNGFTAGEQAARRADAADAVHGRYTSATSKMAIEYAARICESVNNHDSPMTAQDCADAIRRLATPASEPAPEARGSLLRNAGPLPSGCYCKPGKCAAPVVMGRQTACRDPAKAQSAPEAKVVDEQRARELLAAEMGNSSTDELGRVPLEYALRAITAALSAQPRDALPKQVYALLDDYDNAKLYAGGFVQAIRALASAPQRKEGKE